LSKSNFRNVSVSSNKTLKSSFDHRIMKSCNKAHNNFKNVLGIDILEFDALEAVSFTELQKNIFCRNENTKWLDRLSESLWILEYLLLIIAKFSNKLIFYKKSWKINFQL